MFNKNNELTNPNLRIYKEEHDRLIQEKRRIELQMDAILIASAIQLEKAYNTHRLDYSHLINAYYAYVQDDLDRMQFKIVDTTIRDLFFFNEKDFEFLSIVMQDSEAYEFLYKYNKNTISIKIPSTTIITKDKVNSLEWGVFTVFDIVKNTDTEVEKIIIVRSDDTDTIKQALCDYLNTEEIC